MRSSDTDATDRAGRKPGHGILPRHRRASAALLLIDVINDLEFPGASALVRQAVPMARRLARLKARAVEADVPVIYVNDNFGQWRSDFRSLVSYCTSSHVAGSEVATLLLPGPDDYFVLKPKHSGFYRTTLDLLLDDLGVETLILTGMAGNICVLFTANDAYMRGFKLWAPEDCLVSTRAADNQMALKQMRNLMHARTTSSARFSLRRYVSARVRPAGTPKTRRRVT